MIKFQQQLEKISKKAKRNLFPPTDCLVTIGHSITQYSSDKWVPSKLAQSVIETGTWPDGGRKYKRTGTATKTQRELLEEESAIMGGGVFAVAGAAYLYKELASKGEAPKVVLHCGGRPGYLDERAPDNPDLTEAKIMHPAFSRRAGDALAESSTEQILFEASNNTKDDIVGALETALEKDCANVTLVALETRLPRCQAFYDQALAENPKYQELRVNFIAAESLLGEMCRRKGRKEQWKKVLARFQNSKPYQRTFEDEEAGYKAVIRRTYAGTGKT